MCLLHLDKYLVDSTHVNYHEIHYANSVADFETNLNNPSWEFQFKDHDQESEATTKKNKKDSSEMAFWLLIGMIPILIILFLMFRKKF